MILRIILSWCIFLIIIKSGVAQIWEFPRPETTSSPPLAGPPPPRCLTGYMTDVQDWVDEHGYLTSNIDLQTTIDVSATNNVGPMIQQQIQGLRYLNNNSVIFMSMAKCKLKQIPMVFQIRDTQGRALRNTVEFLTLYGNEFVDISNPGEQYNVALNATDAQEMDPDFDTITNGVAAWSAGLQGITFSHLRQLDMRKCSIHILSDNLFQGMPKLEALYLSENSITFVSPTAFRGLSNLFHLDMSRNVVDNDSSNLIFGSMNVFGHLKKLKSLDLSFTKIKQRNMNVLRSLGKNIERLSLCHTGLTRLRDHIFHNTSLKYLDLSGNRGILTGQNIICGIEDTLQVLYAEEISLKTMDILYKFHNLEILKLTNNEVSLITPRTAKSLTNLKILDLSHNRIGTGFIPTFSKMTNLELLSLQHNNINLISEEMITDFRNISYLALSGNFIVCNCHCRELFELALRNENYYDQRLLGSNEITRGNFNYHAGFEDFNRLIVHRKRVNCGHGQCGDGIVDLEVDGNFILFDYDTSIYECLLISEGRETAFSNVQTCKQSKRDIDLQEVINDGWNLLFILLVIPTVILPILILTFVFRRNFKYFFITLRNSATLSLLNKNDAVDETTIFNYDVFVSYCNEDRDWVLDYLLPHVEKDCNISVCLHERDFQVPTSCYPPLCRPILSYIDQKGYHWIAKCVAIRSSVKAVGLSILENIVSCMDRSRSIMLILSKEFLRSRWCQFEMHLAQHRLLETRRENLILILLEDIPRRMRPTTLHYLMLTKTYIVWPKEESEQALFWRRVKKTFTHRLRHNENTSLA